MFQFRQISTIATVSADSLGAILQQLRERFG